MKDRIKILIGFCSIIFLIFFQLAITYKLQRGILKNTIQINSIEAPLGLMVGWVIGYDAILTSEIQTALLHAQSGDYESINKYKLRYNDTAIKLDDLLKKDIKILLRQSQRSQQSRNEVLVYMKAIDEYNNKLVDLETRAFAALDNKDPETAYFLIMGEDYHKYKAALSSLYQDWEKIEKEETSIVGKAIENDSERIILINLIVSIFTILVLLGLLLLIRFFLTDQYKLNMLLFQSSRDAIMTIKPPTWSFNSGNAAALKMFNVKDEKKFFALSLEDLSPLKQADGQLSSVKAKKMIEQAMKDGSALFEWTHKRYRGKDFKATVLLSKIDVKGGAYLQATVRDIDAEKKMLEKTKINISNKKI